MQWSELRELASAQVEQARAVLAAYPNLVPAVALTDPAMSAQSFRSRYDELRWFDLILFTRTIWEALNRNAEAFRLLPRQVQVIEEEFGLAGSPIEAREATMMWRADDDVLGH